MKTNPGFIEFEQHYQFEDRLFDRDTLFLLQYDINFMFVLNAYVNKNKAKNKVFFDKAKELFKDDFTSYIADQYTFFVLKHKEDPALYGLSAGSQVGVDVAIDKYFRKLSGKIFCPSPDSDLMILALQKDNGILLQEQQDLITNISAAFEIYPYKFGDNPEDSLRKILYPGVVYTITEDLRLVPQRNQLQGRKVIDNSQEEYALVGYYRNANHRQWIIDNGIYNCRVNENARTTKMRLEEIRAKYLILHNRGLGTFVYRVTSVAPYIMSSNELPLSESYHPHHNLYMIYDIDTSCESDQIPSQLFETSRFEAETRHYRPIGIRLSKLKEAARNVSGNRLREILDQEEDLFCNMAADETDING